MKDNTKCRVLIAGAEIVATLFATANLALADMLWAQYGFDPAHTSFNASEGVLSRDNVRALTFNWSAKAGSSPASTPIVGKGILYVASADSISAWNTATGTLLWSRLSCSGVDTVQPALGDFGLFVGDGGGDLAGYNPTTGEQMWCRDEGGSISFAPAVDGNTIYVCNGSELAAVDQLTGDQRWRFTPVPASSVSRTPAIADGVVYATGDTVVFALGQATGKQIWRKDLGPQYNLSSPAVGANTVYVGGSILFALNIPDGSIRWTNNSVGVNVSSPAIANGKVFVNSQDPRWGLAAFTADTGELLWQAGAPGESLASVVVANGVVYDLGETGSLFLFNSDTGAPLGAISDPDGQRFNSFWGAQPAVVNATVYVSTSDVPSRVDVFNLVPEPSLTIARLGKQVVISWPTNTSGFRLESATSLSNGSSWSAVFEEVLNSTTNDLVNNRFYRLHKP